MRSMILVLLLVATVAVQAKKKDEAVGIAEVNSALFEQQRAEIVAGFENGEKYAEITGKQRSDVLAALDRMEVTLGGAPSVDALPQDAKVRLFNDQEVVNTILTDAHEQSRIKCKRSRGVNSRLPVNECRTVAEWERKRTEARDLIEERQRLLTLPLPVRPNPHGS